jgi:hypothetical protein
MRSEVGGGLGGQHTLRTGFGAGRKAEITRKQPQKGQGQALRAEVLCHTESGT